MEKQPGSLSRGKERALKAGMAVGSIILVLVAGEGFLRLTTPKEIMRYYFVAPDSVLHHRFIRNASGRYESTEFDTHYQINSLGLRDREYGEKQAGTFRILMLGDSFTEGDGVESNETFSKVLEARLNGRRGPLRYEVVNAGVGSYSPLLEYLYLTREGLLLKPDLVILNLDMSDFYDDISYTGSLTTDAGGLPVAVSPNGFQARQAGILASCKDFFKDHTRLYNFLRLRIDHYIEGARHKGAFTGDLQFDKYAMFRVNYAGKEDREWQLTYRYIGLAAQLCREKGIDFWMTVYPYGMQVSPREWAIGRRFWGFKPDTLYSTAPQALNEKFARNAGIPVVNMCEKLRDTSRTVFPLYFPDNGHWTPRGHAAVAGILYDALDGYFRAKEEAARGSAVTN